MRGKRILFIFALQKSIVIRINYKTGEEIYFSIHQKIVECKASRVATLLTWDILPKAQSETKS
jgi:hypothetical protein